MYELDLNDLLTESVELSTERKKEKAAAKLRPRSAYGTATLTDPALSWRAASDVAMFTIQTCSCGTVSSIFTGLFQHQKHRHQHHIERWIAADEVVESGLEKTIKTLHVDVPMCHFCVEEYGYPVEQLFSEEEGEAEELDEIEQLLLEGREEETAEADDDSEEGGESEGDFEADAPDTAYAHSDETEGELE